MDSSTAWKVFFDKWPKSLARTGVLVTAFGDQIPFDGFMHTETMMLVDRRSPDTVGARKVILPFVNVAAVKIDSVIDAAAFEDMGFVGKLKQK